MRLLCRFVVLATIGVGAQAGGDAMQGNAQAAGPLTPAGVKIKWSIGPSVSYASISVAAGIIPGSELKLLAKDGDSYSYVEVPVVDTTPTRKKERLDAKDGSKLVLVPISWSIDNADPVRGQIRVGNRLFQATQAGDPPRPGVAITPTKADFDSKSQSKLGGSESEHVEMWWIPSRGEGVEFLIDAGTFHAHTITVAFEVPQDWRQFEIVFDKSIATVVLDGQEKRGEPALPDPPHASERDANAELAPGETAVVTHDANLVLGDRVLAKLPRGTQVKVSAVKGGWIGASVVVNGQTKLGWVRRSHVGKKLDGKSRSPVVQRDDPTQTHGMQISWQRHTPKPTLISEMPSVVFRTGEHFSHNAVYWRVAIDYKDADDKLCTWSLDGTVPFKLNGRNGVLDFSRPVQKDKGYPSASPSLPRQFRKHLCRNGLSAVFCMT